tara:strand:+ start:228 stop:1205 length:978 start_codon:yes stop_codon:yes gene_type:complete
MSCPNNEATKLESKKNEECKENCEFNHNYNPNSSCVLTNKGNYLEIKTDGKNNVSYNGQNLTLANARFYSPSLHTFDGKHLDGEMILTHHGNGLNVIVSVPVKSSKGSGNSIDFFSKITPYVPSEKNENQTVNVSNWSLNDVMPAAKTPFYNYKGSSPYPPCHMKATMIVFDPDYAVAIKSSDLSIIKKVIKPAKKSSSNKEGFVGGMMGGFKEGLVTYNSGGSNNTDKDEGGEAMVCTEYYDTDPEASKSGVSIDGTSDTSIKKPSIDWSKITQSPYFIGGIILLVLILGFIFIKFVVPKIFAKLNKSSDVMAAPEAELEIPST